MQTEETQMQQAFEKAQAEAQEREQKQEEKAQEVQTNGENQAPQDAANATPNDNESEIDFDPKELVTENEQLKSQLSALEAKYKADNDKLVRALAECENQKKRIEADVERERKFGNEKILKALIPVVDSLELALKHSDVNDPAIKPIVEGVQNTTTLLLKELGKFGVEAVDPQGQPFDPNLHQAISMVPSPEVEAQHVLSVMQKGYTLNGRVVRPAMVIVSAGAPAGAKPNESASQDNGEQKNSINIYYFNIYVKIYTNILEMRKNNVTKKIKITRQITNKKKCGHTFCILSCFRCYNGSFHWVSYKFFQFLGMETKFKL